ncbi:site-specific recombinase [Ramlibacter sp. H39-3-26]|uniref:site-specific recombinase n=1 Tax=Curvibacter soli TaxID=3031331 RepID=UPI0023DA5634|nr:site-specific recombinase [Ramlibacter sp. H39-3-26]MDF1486130.1 site-specific recombinase [Ramlibacter sp. H39-3-26]
MTRPRDLDALLAALDPAADLAGRHLWLLSLLEWIRGSRRGSGDAVARVRLLLAAAEARPAVRTRLAAWWRTLEDTVDVTPLLADLGFAPRTALFSEASERLRRKLLPGTPETVDAAELFVLARPTAFDVQWLSALEEADLARLEALLAKPEATGASHWQQALMDAIAYCASQIAAAGCAPELRLRMRAAGRDTRPFLDLMRDVETLRVEVLHGLRHDDRRDAAAQQLRERLDACRHAAATVYTHLEENGISVGLVFRLRQLRERALRIRALLDCVLSPQPGPSAVRLLAHLAAVAQERRSLRALIASNSSLLAAKVTERSAETGEHYITRDRTEYLAMVRKACGGGVLTAGTTFLKFVVMALGLPAFWSGFWAGAVYAGSFVLIQLLHFTLATKQPAMTAPAMAARLKELSGGHAVDDFADEVTHLVRTQVAAVLGNVLLVVPAVLALSVLIQWLLGHPMIDAREAGHVLHSLHLLGPTALFAGATGVLLFASSIIAGWVENWFVLHRLDSALRYNPRITALLGTPRAARWARFMRENISGFAANVSLGFMLGLVPAFAAFFGIGFEVRHVTLSAGQLAAAGAALGWESLRTSALWWGAASLPLVGALNVVVSFYCAFRLALRAHNVSGVDRARIRAAIRARMQRAPLHFLLP